jgi:hypothetical protein
MVARGNSIKMELIGIYEQHLAYEEEIYSLYTFSEVRIQILCISHLSNRTK